ncbi:nuclear transport factor 2 family protein [Dokdonia sp. Hel_I_53]|uniref:nuclear transport factor 2 family protein n=1 Tax=Dokdonia sp. Hel_I_53 TaxID=1566287 RepID=UPI0011996063|nr:nuclear transport factor 2 family protein [Dokdonia sp. Hel_I_53]TVZ51483.1 hypothetical protein OD90_0626 [Dokdonia sp. Hel_I_53]
MRVLILFLFCFLATQTILAQSDTEIYLFDITEKDGKIKLSNQKNISNTEGYDNQPFFLGKNALIYSGTIDGNTEIVKYVRGTKTTLNTKTIGGEYSPQLIPGDRAVSAVRLDPDGRQRLYRYEPRNPKLKEIIDDAVIAYYTWADNQTIVSATIVNKKLHLVTYDLLNNKSEDLNIIVGRSFHKIPNSNLVSFIDKTNDEWYVKSIDPKTKNIKTITAIPQRVEDIAWLPDGSLLATYESSILLKTKKKRSWTVLNTFEDENLKNLSRITVSPKGDQLAIVSEVSPGVIVKKHIEPFNKKELEPFLKAFSNNVTVSNFISDTLYVGQKLLRSNYEKIFQNKPPITVSVINRIIYKNFVIDEELVNFVDRKHKQVTLYTVGNGKITSMTFITPKPLSKNAQSIIDSQIEYYNSQDLKGFMTLFNKDAAFLNFPSEIVYQSIDDARKSYQEMFSDIPDLHVTIKNRIAIGNYVIDHEKITVGKNHQYGVVISKVIDGKITQVIFL